MRKLLCYLVLFAGALPAFAQTYEIEAPGVVLRGIPYDVTVRSQDVFLDSTAAAEYAAWVNGQSYPLVFDTQTWLDGDGRQLVASGLKAAGGDVTVEVRRGEQVIGIAASRTVPGWLSILPPFLAILGALLFRRVIPALFIGIWIGAWITIGGALGLFTGLFDAFQVFILDAVADADHAAILLFSLMIGGMVGIISRNGGTQGIVNKVVGFASTPQKGQLTTGSLGLAIFFDDYANTLVVGNTMRPLTDRLRISREKLAYIVDSTAAPVACLAFVTTWIGYEVGIIGEAVGQIDGFDESAYSIFLSSIPYSFYPILAIFFVFAVAYSQRDFGPMYDAEVRARTTGQVISPDAKVDDAAAEGEDLKPVEGKPQRALNAVLPIIVLVLGVLVSLWITGEGDTVRDIIGSADSYKALMWASLAGVLTAAALSLGQRILTLEETIEAWYSGLKSMLFAMIILILAWALSAITTELHTADYLVSVIGEALHPGLLPAVVFVLAAATAFATGSSWGTMGILMPLVIPLAWAVLDASGDHSYAEHAHIIYSTVSVVLAGSVWGDHCSPISDTTILSSMASGCDHIDHVRTQIPYAMTVGFVALLLGTLPTGFGFPWWASLLLGLAVLTLGLWKFGKHLPDEVAHLPVEDPVVTEPGF